MSFAPILMKNVDLILGDEATGPNFKCQLKSVELSPKYDVQKTSTLCPDGRYSDVAPPEWELQLGYLYGDDNGQGTVVEILADYLLENAGDKVPFVFRPRSGGRGYRGEVTLLSGGIGGNQNSWMDGKVNLPVSGQPELVAAVDTGV